MKKTSTGVNLITFPKKDKSQIIWDADGKTLCRHRARMHVSESARCVTCSVCLAILNEKTTLKKG